MLKNTGVFKQQEKKKMEKSDQKPSKDPWLRFIKSEYEKICKKYNNKIANNIKYLK